MSNKEFFAAVAVLTQFIEDVDNYIPIKNDSIEPKEENNHGN